MLFQRLAGVGKSEARIGWFSDQEHVGLVFLVEFVLYPAQRHKHIQRRRLIRL